MRLGGLANDFTIDRISSGVLSGSPFFACQIIHIIMLTKTEILYQQEFQTFFVITTFSVQLP